MEITQSEGVVKQNLGIETAPHLKAKLTTPKIMGIVLLSLLPALAMMIFFFGMGVVWQFIICAITAIICEGLVAILRHRKVIHALSDLSYLVTALILAMTLPPLLPVYYSIVATIFAIIVVKSVFGGLGHNIFNPAMAGFIFVVISCPQVMGDTWISPAPAAFKEASLNNTFKVIFEGADNTKLKNQIDALHFTDNSSDNDEILVQADLFSKLDSFTGATFLEMAKTQRKTGSLHEMAYHDFTSSQYVAYLALAIALSLGGLVLMAFRLILIKMVLTFFVSLFIFSFVLSYYFPGYFMPPVDTFLFGGTMLAAFFIITDPVTNAGTSKGRVYFAILCAFLIVILRAFGSYSDAVAFAVMLSNAAAPLIDTLTRRRSFGASFFKLGADK